MPEPVRTLPTDGSVQLSLVVPIFNEEEVIEALHSRLMQVLNPVVDKFEVVLVNDGSRDRSPEMLDSICRADPRFKAIHFSRNFGHQAAVTAGLHAARGAVVVVIDADLQDPPELILDMLGHWSRGSDVVYAQKRRRMGINPLKKFAYFIYYMIINKLTEIEFPPDTGDFCLMDRQIVDLLNAMPERNRYIRGLRAWLGFKQTAILFDRPGRHAGVTKYPFRKMVALATDGILSLSKAPLKIAMYFGFFASAVSFLLALVFVIEKLTGPGNLARGWASTIVIVLFLGGVQLICLGVIGEFIGRIYDEVKQRPLYVIGRSTGL